MKITVDIDCTTEEARHFFGLPDVKPMQEAVMAKLKQRMLEAADVTSPEAILRSWMSFLPQSAEQARQAMEAMFRAPFGMPATGGEEPKKKR